MDQGQSINASETFEEIFQDQLNGYRIKAAQAQSRLEAAAGEYERAKDALLDAHGDVRDLDGRMASLYEQAEREGVELE